MKFKETEMFQCKKKIEKIGFMNTIKRHAKIMKDIKGHFYCLSGVYVIKMKPVKL